jgi:hypothetical protein
MRLALRNPVRARVFRGAIFGILKNSYRFTTPPPPCIFLSPIWNENGIYTRGGVYMVV